MCDVTTVIMSVRPVETTLSNHFSWKLSAREMKDPGSVPTNSCNSRAPKEKAPSINIQPFIIHQL